jgi:hypothetical protein
MTFGEIEVMRSLVAEKGWHPLGRRGGWESSTESSAPVAVEVEVVVWVDVGVSRQFHYRLVLDWWLDFLHCPLGKCCTCCYSCSIGG